MVNIKIIGALKRYSDVDDADGCVDLAFSEGMTVSDILSRLGLKGAGVNIVVMVNGAAKPGDCHICDGDKIIVMPLLAGG